MNKKGQALVEYILIIALMSIIIISLVKFFGGYLKDSITKTSCNLSGLEYVVGDKAGEGYCKDTYLDDLFGNDLDEEEDQDKRMSF